MKKQWTTFQKVVEKYELDTTPNKLVKIWGIKFREESSRTNHELGNIELHELDRYPEPFNANFA